MNQEQFEKDLRMDDEFRITEMKSDHFNPNNVKPESENFVEDYRILRQQQKDFLLKINMSASLKKQIFGFTDLKDHEKPDDNEKLVALIDPFKGRLIMKEKVWQEIEREKEAERLKVQHQIQVKKEQEQYEELKKKTEQQRIMRERLKRQEGRSDEQEVKPEEKNQKGNNFLGTFFRKLSQSPDKNQDKNEDEKIKERKKPIDNRVLESIMEQKNTINEGRIESEDALQDKSEKSLKNRKGYNQAVDPQFNVKIQGYKAAPQLSPSNKSKVDEKLAGNIFATLLAGNKNEKPEFQQGEENLRMESRAKFAPKNDDIYEVISEIPKKDVKEQFSSPSLNVDKKSDAGSIEQMMKPKNRPNRGSGY